MGSPQGVTWSSSPLKGIKSEFPFKPMFKLLLASPCLGSMNAEPVTNITSHKGMRTEAGGICRQLLEDIHSNMTPLLPTVSLSRPQMLIT